LLALAVAAGCGKEKTEGDVQTVRGAIIPDETTPIGQRWRQAVNAGVPIGEATNAQTPVPGYPALYQLFANHAIVWTHDHGAVLLTKAIFDKWFSLTGVLDAAGNPVYNFFGVPTQDYRVLPDREELTFTAGLIAVQGGVARVVFGGIYLKYLPMAAVLGGPLSEETPLNFLGDRFQIFTGGEVHWVPGGLAGWKAIGGTFTLLNGPILDKYRERGRIGLGVPTRDSAKVMKEDPNTHQVFELGFSGKFSTGGLYYNSATGVMREVGHGISDEYENQGGPNGWLGWPLVGPGFTAGGSIYHEFEHGLLVHYDDVEVNVGQPPGVIVLKPLVQPLGNLRFYLQRVEALGQDDCILGVCGALDLSYTVDVDSSAGTLLNNHHVARPEGQDTHEAADDLGASVQASPSLTIDVTIKVVDRDDPPLNDDDNLGTVTAHFDIDNLFGINSIEKRDGDGRATFQMKSTHAFETRDFRGQKYWSFRNFTTSRDDMGYDKFAATFSDVTDEESAWLNPFNRAYYELYKSAAAGGNCHGMNVEQLWAAKGRSRAGMPIHDSYPETQDGSPLSQSRPLYREINIKQGTQLGLESILYRAGRFAAGQTHCPICVFNESSLFFHSDDRPLIGLTDDVLLGKAHSLMPYEYDATRVNCSSNLDADKCIRIWVADPNNPTRDAPATEPAFRRPTDRFIEIEVDQADNEYFYDAGEDVNGNRTTYRGGNWFGGRMLYEPYHLYDGPQVTPYYAAMTLAKVAFFVILGDAGGAQQITDANGRTFFEPGIAGMPTRWDQVRRDDATRIPDIAPINFADKQFPNRAQIWAGTGFGSTHTYEVGPQPGVAAGTPIDVTFHAGTLSSRFELPATLGKVDKIIANQINTFNKSMALELPADAPAKAVSWTIAGAEKQRWLEFTNLGMSPAQRIRMHNENAGKKLFINNAGPQTTANLRAKSGPGASIANLGLVTIPTGDSVIEFLGPKTTLTLGNVSSGNNGWLVALPTITLTAQDRSGFGIERIEYSNDNVNWTTYTAPFQYTIEGVSTLYYRARDNASNIEPSNAQALKIDTRRPTTTGSISTTSGVTLTYAVTDPTPGSGVAGLRVLQGIGTPTASFLTAASGTVALAGTCSAVEFWGEDVAGNTTTPHLSLADTTGPTFTTFPTAVINTTVCRVQDGLVLGTATAVDDCGGSVTVTNNAPAKFPLGTTIVTWTARDARGNITTRTQTVNADLGNTASCCPTGSNIMMGTSNNDTLNGTAGADCIIGLGAQDTIRGNGGNDAISGGDGDDLIWGGDGNDWLAGGQGQDILRGENGNDTCSGGDGDDQLYGGNNDDRLMGGQGQDQIFGEAGNDNLAGDSGFDTLNGGIGNDFLRGGTENDNLTGGGGTDQCVQDGGDTLNACTAVAP
jgi:hypothetical protein